MVEPPVCSCVGFHAHESKKIAGINPLISLRKISIHRPGDPARDLPLVAVILQPGILVRIAQESHLKHTDRDLAPVDIGGTVRLLDTAVFRACGAADSVNDLLGKIVALVVKTGVIGILGRHAGGQRAVNAGVIHGTGMKTDQDIGFTPVCRHRPLRAAHVHIVDRADHDDMIAAIYKLFFQLFATVSVTSYSGTPLDVPTAPSGIFAFMVVEDGPIGSFEVFAFA